MGQIRRWVVKREHSTCNVGTRTASARMRKRSGARILADTFRMPGFCRMPRVRSLRLRCIFVALSHLRVVGVHAGHKYVTNVETLSTSVDTHGRLHRRRLLTMVGMLCICSSLDGCMSICMGGRFIIFGCVYVWRMPIRVWECVTVHIFQEGKLPVALLPLLGSHPLYLLEEVIVDTKVRKSRIKKLTSSISTTVLLFS